MDKIIIDKTTRIIRAVTTDEDPLILPTEEIVPAGFKVFLNVENPKLLADNQTIVGATPEEVELYADIQNPGRKKKRELSQALDETVTILNDRGDDKLADVLQKLKDYIG